MSLFYAASYRSHGCNHDVFHCSWNDLFYSRLRIRQNLNDSREGRPTSRGDSRRDLASHSRSESALPRRHRQPSATVASLGLAALANNNFVCESLGLFGGMLGFNSMWQLQL